MPQQRDSDSVGEETEKRNPPSLQIVAHQSARGIDGNPGHLTKMSLGSGPLSHSGGQPIALLKPAFRSLKAPAVGSFDLPTFPPEPSKCKTPIIRMLELTSGAVPESGAVRISGFASP